MHNGILRSTFTYMVKPPFPIVAFIQCLNISNDICSSLTLKLAENQDEDGPIKYKKVVFSRNIDSIYNLYQILHKIKLFKEPKSWNHQTYERSRWEPSLTLKGSIKNLCQGHYDVGNRFTMYYGFTCESLEWHIPWVSILL